MKKSKILMGFMLVAMFIFSIFSVAAVDVLEPKPVLISEKPLVDARLRERIDAQVNPKGELKRDTTRLREAIKLGDKEAIEAAKKELVGDIRSRIRTRSGAIDKEKIEGMAKSEIGKLSKLSRDQLEKFKGLSKENIQKELKNMKVLKVKKDDYVKKREINKDKLQKSKERYEVAKNRYQEKKLKYQENKKDFQDAVESGDEEAAMVHAKDMLANAADAIIAHLEKVMEKVNEDENLDSEEASEIISDIESKLSDIKEAKETIANAETKDEIKESAKVINAHVKKSNEAAKNHAAKIKNAGINGLIKRAELLEKKVDRIFEKALEKGIDTTEYESIMVEFAGSITAAKENYEKAQEIISSTDATKEERESAHELIKEAHDYVKDAHDDVKEIFRDLIDVAKEVKDDEYVEVAVEEDEEEIVGVEVTDEELVVEVEETETIDAMETESENMDSTSSTDESSQ